MSTENPPSSAGHCEAEGKANLLNPGVWLSLAAFLGLVVWFFCFENRYGSGHSHSTLGWLYGSWNPSTDYEHGKLRALVIIGLIVYRFKDLKNGVQPGSMWGLLAWQLAACSTCGLQDSPATYRGGWTALHPMGWCPLRLGLAGCWRNPDLSPFFSGFAELPLPRFSKRPPIYSSSLRQWLTMDRVCN